MSGLLEGVPDWLLYLDDHGVLQGAGDFSAGVSSALTFGLSDKLIGATGLGKYGSKCSGAYFGGHVGGMVLGIIEGPATLAKGAAVEGAQAARALEEGLEASSSINSILLKNRLISEEIAGGHAFAKHVIEQAEFAGITTRAEFAEHIEEFLNSSETVTRTLSKGRSAFWNEGFGAVLIRNPTAADGGTFFRPTAGAAYFWGLL